MSNQVYKDSVNKYITAEINDLKYQIDVILLKFESYSFTTTFIPVGAVITVSPSIDIYLSKYEKMSSIRFGSASFAYDAGDPATNTLKSSSAIPVQFNIGRHFVGVIKISTVQQELGFCNLFTFGNIFSSVNFGPGGIIGWKSFTGSSSIV